MLSAVHSSGMLPSLKRGGKERQPAGPLSAVLVTSHAAAGPFESNRRAIILSDA